MTHPTPLRSPPAMPPPAVTEPVVIPNGWPPLTNDADYLDLAAEVMERRGLNKTGGCGSPLLGPVCLWLAVRLADSDRPDSPRYWRLNDWLTVVVREDGRVGVREGNWPEWAKHPDTTTADAVALLRSAATLARADEGR